MSPTRVLGAVLVTSALLLGGCTAATDDSSGGGGGTDGLEEIERIADDAESTAVETEDSLSQD